ncbi:D-glycero-beta-D-manno-heptose 1-phosphate adenylyltransferase [Nocardioides sp. NPDC006273]|uniref:D-glycero-beta-D-manno-heptose 1-phosphate adenylyltransferase n=1 Tax=Nocardioides sp. NPDC006273 TaxID=3155598 RepID=UPI0033BD1CEE
MSVRMVVVGDTLLDVDVTGDVRRRLPEADAPVIDDPRERLRPGGAGLAAALAAADGHDVVLVTALAADAASSRIHEMCRDAGVNVLAVPQDGSTPVKRRIIADQQPVARLDEGACGSIAPVPADALDAIGAADAVLVSDYGQGLSSVDNLRSALTGIAATTSTPVVWDPHPRGAAPTPGVRLATPNRAEAAGFVGRVASTDPSDHAAALVGAWGAQAVCVTVGSDGAVLAERDAAPQLIPTQHVGPHDTCGAGDRFAATVTASLAGTVATEAAVKTAVEAAGDFVASGGAASFTPVERRTEERTVVATGGCFDLLHAGHIATLQAARRLGQRLVVCLNSDESVRRLKGEDRPLVPERDRARLLAALDCVDDVVVFDEDTPVDVLARIRPHVWVKGGDYAEKDLPESDLLATWGGRTVVVPYHDGHSTTSLIETARATSV